MKIDIRPLLREVNLVLEIDLSGDESIEVSDFQDYHFTSPLSFLGELRSENSGILRLSGEAKIDLETVCVRCHEAIKRTYSITVNERIYPNDYRQNLMDELELSEEEMDSILPSEDYDPDDLLYHNKIYVELEKFLEDLLILELPIGLYCEEDCNGLCPNCGEKKTSAQCKCEVEVAEDSPFAVLKDLL